MMSTEHSAAERSIASNSHKRTSKSRGEILAELRNKHELVYQAKDDLNRILAELRNKHELVYQARDDLNRYITENFQIGDDVMWIKNHRAGIQRGFVVLNSPYGRIKVENSRTGKESWIEPYHLLLAAGKRCRLCKGGREK